MRTHGIMNLVVSARSGRERFFHACSQRHTTMLAVFLAVLLLLPSFSTFCLSRTKVPKHPNVLLIIIDTLRADHLGCYGYNRNTSPNIDSLSSSSILFKNAIASAPWTTPSVGSIFTSQYPAVLGINERPSILHEKHLTLAEVFQSNGYKTKGIISHALLSTTLGFHQGFDSYDEENSKGHGHISSPSLVEKAISFLENSKDEKFFLFIHFFDPHYDYIQHEQYNYYLHYDGDLHSGLPIKELRKKAPSMTNNDIDYIKALYDSEIRFTDEYIGKLFDKLKELDLFSNTLIVLTADHGEEFTERGDHWIGHTKTLYQEQLHVPLMIKLPGNGKRKNIEEYFGLIDLMPAIINFADLAIPDSFQNEGNSVNLENGRISETKPIISQTRRKAKLKSVVWNDWKYIYSRIANKGALYNLKRDPMETENVALTNEKVTNDMKAILQEWNNDIRIKSSATRYQKPDFTEEQLEQLKSLGYTE